MPLYCQWIIDTPEFQRLRFIKQLGCTCYVFPSAVHTRFDHSIGVSHLAGRLAKILQENDRGIQANEIACVEIAGLCHDLGHGPFSHAFEDIVPPDKQGKKWTHEEQSVVLFEYLIKKNNLKRRLEDYGIYEQEIQFICELIIGRSRSPGNKLIRENKYYLYQIVNNTVNGVDVDKWDYFARDTHFLGMQSAFNFNRLIPFVKVFEVLREPQGEPRKELCFRDKVASDLNHMFLTRRRLHYASYQHRVTKIITIMLKDAFLAANNHLKFVGENDREYSLLDTVRDPKAFCQVNDSVINEIMRSRSREAGMMRAKEIVDRIHRRQLYQCIVEIQHANELLRTLDPAEIKRCVVADDDDIVLSVSTHDDQIWLPENIEVEVSYFDYGKGDDNPLLHVPFYKKSHDGRGVKARLLPQDKLPADLPQRFQDVTVRMYTKVPDLKRTVIKHARNYFYSKARRLFRRREPPGTPLKQISFGSSSPLSSSPPVGAVSPISSLLASSGSLRDNQSEENGEEGSSNAMIGSPGLQSDPELALVAGPGSDSGPIPRPLSSRETEPEASVTVVKRKLDFGEGDAKED